MDDDPAETVGLLSALGKAGIGCVHLTGTVEELPSTQLRGIRLAVLDMFLQPAMNMSAEEAAGMVANILETVLAPDNGPYVAITWTKEEDAAKAFAEAIGQLDPAKRPLRVLSLDKTTIKSDEARYDQAAILERVREAVEEIVPLSVVVDWEQLVHEAATDTTRSLLPSSDDWPEGAADSLAALMRENVTSAELRAERPDPGMLRTGLWGALQPIHLDYVEQRSSVESTNSSALKALADRAVSLRLSADHAAALNSSLMLGRPNEGLWPGHIYRLDEVYPDLTWQQQNQSELTAAVAEDIFQRPSDTAPLAKREEFEKALAECVPVVLEISPGCDHYQGNLSAGRVVVGFLVPHAHTVKRGPLSTSGERAIRKVIGPFLVGPLGDSAFSLVLNARYVSGCDPRAMSRVQAIARLREAPLADVQSWAVSHGGRVGMLQVRFD